MGEVLDETAKLVEVVDAEIENVKEGKPMNPQAVILALSGLQTVLIEGIKAYDALTAYIDDNISRGDLRLEVFQDTVKRLQDQGKVRRDLKLPE